MIVCLYKQSVQEMRNHTSLNYVRSVRGARNHSCCVMQNLNRDAQSRVSTDWLPNSFFSPIMFEKFQSLHSKRKYRLVVLIQKPNRFRASKL